MVRHLPQTSDGADRPASVNNRSFRQSKTALPYAAADRCTASAIEIANGLARDQSFFLSFRLESPFAAQGVLAQRVIDGRIAQQGRHKHGGKARDEHRQQHRRVGGHLSNEHNAGQRGAHHAGEKGGHSDDGKSFCLNIQLRKC